MTDENLVDDWSERAKHGVSDIKLGNKIKNWTLPTLAAIRTLQSSPMYVHEPPLTLNSGAINIANSAKSLIPSEATSLLNGLSNVGSVRTNPLLSNFTSHAKNKYGLPVSETVEIPSLLKPDWLDRIGKPLDKVAKPLSNQMQSSPTWKAIGLADDLSKGQITRTASDIYTSPTIQSKLHWLAQRTKPVFDKAAPVYETVKRMPAVQLSVKYNPLISKSLGPAAYTLTGGAGAIAASNRFANNRSIRDEKWDITDYGDPDNIAGLIGDSFGNSLGSTRIAGNGFTDFVVRGGPKVRQYQPHGDGITALANKIEAGLSTKTPGSLLNGGLTGGKPLTFDFGQERRR
jgi:hypothetical protein